MEVQSLTLKIKKRIIHFLRQVKSIETYFLTIVGIDNSHTFFDYYGKKFSARNDVKSSDYQAVNQVLVDEEYSISVKLFLNSKKKINTVIDAGANIGSTTIYVKHFFPCCRVFCIEPEDTNYSLLQKNVSEYIQDGSVSLYKNGLMGQAGLSLEIVSDFRDKSDWAKQVKVSSDVKNVITSISISKIIEDNKLESIDLLKIDIEGAEVFLLEENVNLDFLSITKCIAIEIHDEFNCREGIYEILNSRNFIIIEEHETVTAVNMKLFNGK